jgi:hypothetical protein
MYCILSPYSASFQLPLTSCNRELCHAWLLVVKSADGKGAQRTVPQSLLARADEVT